MCAINPKHKALFLFAAYTSHEVTADEFEAACLSQVSNAEQDMNSDVHQMNNKKFSLRWHSHASTWFIVAQEFDWFGMSLTSTKLIGPFVSHHEANSAMQQLHDEKLLELEKGKGWTDHDDTDANKFQVEDDNRLWVWSIVEHPFKEEVK